MTRRNLTPEEEATVLLTAGQAGTLMGVSGKTVVQWAKEGRIPYTTTLGGHHRFNRADIDRLIREDHSWQA